MNHNERFRSELWRRGILPGLRCASTHSGTPLTGTSRVELSDDDKIAILGGTAAQLLKIA